MGEIVQQLLDVIAGMGYWGIMLGLAIEIVPSEVVLSYAGYLVYQQRISEWEAVLFGVAGIMIAQILLYWIGKYGGRPFVEKYGKYLLLKSKHIDLAERWFNRYGAGIVFTSRFIPVLRQAVSIPAGMARMPLYRFCLYTLLATVPWAILFVYFGKLLGQNWEDIHQKAGPLVIPFMIGAVALAVLYFLAKARYGRKRGAKAAGKAGERATAHQLKFLGSDYKVMHGKTIRAGGSRQEFDHVAIGPNGIFHIETKHWSGQVSFTGDGIERDGDRATTTDPTSQMYRHEFILKTFVRESGFKADIVGILCFSHPNVRVNGGSPAFPTMKLDQLLHFIKSYRPQRTLSSKEVKRIYLLLQERSKSV